MKTYRIDGNEAAFLHTVNGAFAGIDYLLDNIRDGKKFNKQAVVKTIKEILSQANIAISSEYIRGELIKKGVLDNDPTLLCTFDPSEDNKDLKVEVYTRDDLLAKDIANKNH